MKEFLKDDFFNIILETTRFITFVVEMKTLRLRRHFTKKRGGVKTRRINSLYDYKTYSVINGWLLIQRIEVITWCNYHIIYTDIIIILIVVGIFYITDV